MASSTCPMCDRKVKLLARKSGAPGNLERILRATNVALRYDADYEARRGYELSTMWHSYLHGEFRGTLPFAELNAFYARVDALSGSQH